MKKKSIYRRKLTRALRSTFKQYNSLQSYTAEEACQRLREIFYRKGKY
jgi:hypothetical protein